MAEYDAEEGGHGYAPSAGRLDPEGARIWRFGCGRRSRASGGGGGRSSGDGESRHGEQQQSVTNDSGPEVGQPHCCSTQARSVGGGEGRRANDVRSPDEEGPRDACDAESVCHELRGVLVRTEQSPRRAATDRSVRVCTVYGRSGRTGQIDRAQLSLHAAEQKLQQRRTGKQAIGCSH